ncbi:class D beta-lactamase [Desulfovibrio inopinatus]|uniref:class D beta-lactamase n=1 Tax=Desulfovibrio inopinatus TaxID=102109 RepID=UPI0003F8794E|nr:class D beta-lactamase [Desulfovibrio inopinatus]
MRICLSVIFMLIVQLCCGVSGLLAFEMQQDEQLQKVIEDAGVTGVVIVEEPSGKCVTSDSTLANTGAIPASTFKILHALIALETGVIADENAVIPWDGKKRNVAAWNKDQTLKSAIANSTVWVFQGFARKIGPERMQEYVDRADYGNHNIGGDIDSFWLDGELRISPVQQIPFLKKLYDDALPFSKRNMDIVKQCLEKEHTETTILRGKTGWAQQTGWFVGWLENTGHPWFFATRIDMPSSAQAAARMTINNAALEQVGALP